MIETMNCMPRGALIQSPNMSSGSSSFVNISGVPHVSPVRTPSFFKSLLEEFICPITMDIPLDPVTAEDGKIYERAAIEALINHTRGNSKISLRSPITNEPMGPKLSPATHVKNVIEKIIESGVIPQDDQVMERWVEHNENKKKFEKLMQKAQTDDLDAVKGVGDCYADGQLGVTKNAQEAYSWYNRAAKLGHIESMACAGYCLTCGMGVALNETEGLALLRQAAEGGSGLAAAIVGEAYGEGYFGAGKDLKRAVKWLKRAAYGNCKFRVLESNMNKIQSLLDRYQQLLNRKVVMKQ